MNFRPSKRSFYTALAALAAILVGFTAAREIWGAFLPPIIDENLYNGVIVAVLGLFLWNRKIRSDEAKELALEEARKAEAEKAEAEKAAAKDGNGGE
jgi:hypothetical protein